MKLQYTTIFFLSSCILFLIYNLSHKLYYETFTSSTIFFSILLGISSLLFGFALIKMLNISDYVIRGIILFFSIWLSLIFTGIGCEIIAYKDLRKNGRYTGGKIIEKRIEKHRRSRTDSDNHTSYYTEKEYVIFYEFVVNDTLRVAKQEFNSYFWEKLEVWDSLQIKYAPIKPSNNKVFYFYRLKTKG